MLIMLQHDTEIQPEDWAVQGITSLKIRAGESLGFFLNHLLNRKHPWMKLFIKGAFFPKFFPCLAKS